MTHLLLKSATVIVKWKFKATTYPFHLGTPVNFVSRCWAVWIIPHIICALCWWPGYHPCYFPLNLIIKKYHWDQLNLIKSPYYYGFKPNPHINPHINPIKSPWNHHLAHRLAAEPQSPLPRPGDGSGGSARGASACCGGGWDLGHLGFGENSAIKNCLVVTAVTGNMEFYSPSGWWWLEPWNFILHLNLVGGDWNHGILFSIKNWLVVTGTLEFYSPSKTVWWWLEPWNFMNSMIYGNVIIPTDEHILQRSRSTTNQKMWLKPWRNDDRWFQTAPGNEDSNMFKPQKKAKQV